MSILDRLIAAVKRGQRPGPKRLLWILNHKTLLPAEVPILRSLGFAVLIPKIVPHGPDYGDALVSNGYDADLLLAPEALAILNNHNFYETPWNSAVTETLNRNFDVVVTSVYTTTPLFEAVTKFEGIVVARVFGREAPNRYTTMFESAAEGSLLDRMADMGDRFVFGQGFDNLAEIEDERLARRAHTLLVAIPDTVWSRGATWTGEGPRAVLLLSPKINDVGYYTEIYRDLKATFWDVPHQIFGRQFSPVDDPTVLPYLSDDALLALYAKSPVFAYASTEPRHVHYSPIEAMIVGTPILYRAGGMIDFLAGVELAGQCTDAAEMKRKTLRILDGDVELSNTIRTQQGRIVESFATDLARRQWAGALGVEA